jgi:hypothetical protein
MQKITGVIKYDCIKCTKPVALHVIPSIQENTVELFRSMFDSKLCMDCHCDKKVPELAECLVH